MVDQTIERRAFARIEINSTIEYFMDDKGTTLAGMLDNMSPGGFLLWTEQALPLGAKVFISITPDKEAEAPIKVTATVIRINDEKSGPNFGYGCLIEDVTEVS